MKNTPPRKAARGVCLAVLLAALVYGLILPFCWGNDPADTYGTLSILCENRIPWFWLWVLLTGGGLALNLELLFRKYGYSGAALRVCTVFGLLGLILTAATLNHSVLDWNPKRVLHWIGAVCYAVGILAAFLFFFFKKVRACKRFLPFLALVVCIIAGVVLQMLTVGRNGYMEIVPIALLELTLLILVYTPAIPPSAEKPTAGG